MTAGDALNTPPKSKRKLRDVTGPKRQLIEVAQQFRYIERAPVYGVDVEEFDRLDGGVVRSVREDAPFRDVWEEIVDVMSVLGAVETREESTGPEGQVVFTALTKDSRRLLRVQYYGDGRLEVRATWRESPAATMAMVVFDKTYSLD